MKECAFCSQSGKLSLEHITSEWMGPLFPGKIAARRFDHLTGADSEWRWNSLDFKAKVVCKKCNETWMSEIEREHAKPVLTPLITGKFSIPIGLKEAHSLALFSFKTAVILDHAAQRGELPFFDESSRHAFRETLTIPSGVQMWLCPFLRHRGNGAFLTLYHQPEPSTGEKWLMYVCTFAIGHLAIQVVALKGKMKAAIISPISSLELLAVPYWPDLQPSYIWPESPALRNRDDFKAFAERWQKIELIS